MFGSMICLLALASQSAWSLGNFIVDPGFERYHYDNGMGCYLPDATAAWTEYGYGTGSVLINASTWTAPAEMSAEAPLGFSPGGGGFTGEAYGQNRGVLYLYQDITTATALPLAREYEAWVWLGGAGRDNDNVNGPDHKEERGGWMIYWYDNKDTSSWNDNNAMEIHKSEREYNGSPNSFVRIYGSGMVPLYAQGFRFYAYALSWVGDKPVDGVDTQVALDNAYYGIPPNSLLYNGSFEEDTAVGEFRGWAHPDPWFDVPDTIEVGNQLMAAGYEFLLPYRPRAKCYGYDAFSHGWLQGAFSFGQEADVSGYGEGSSYELTFYWHQNTRNDAKTDSLRRPMARVNVGLAYLDAQANVINSESQTVVWPYSSGQGNSSNYDNNNNTAYNHRISVNPPAGSKRIGVHIELRTNAYPYAPDTLFLHGIDEVQLRMVNAMPTATPTMTATLTPTYSPTCGPHISDQNHDWQIDFSLALLMISRFNNGNGAYSCGPQADGYQAGGGSHACGPHCADYNGNWKLDFAEMSRFIQFFNMGYHCQTGTVDGWSAGP